MKIKFEVKSNRVKGLAFHSSLPLLLASLHNGAINLYDYNTGLQVNKFEEHEGPVRGLDFHRLQPIFASGGDDFKVKIWNFYQKKCLFTFSCHTDYVRTVNFHYELPWLVTASDDQTLRILNWQSRTVLAVVAGHTHYVMNAFFHPEEDIIISSSLDETVRVWDFHDLKKKFAAGSKSSEEQVSSTDVSVKILIDSHDKPVNWACFHPKKKLIASASDDKSVRVWRYTESRAWELDSLRGHSHNVTSVVFHPNLDIVISCSEDKTVRVWDYSTHAELMTHKKDSERFWVVIAHPTQNYFAAGHDGGLIFFTIESLKIPLQKFNDGVLRIMKKEIQYYDINTEKLKVISLVPNFNKEYSNFSVNPKHFFVNYHETSAYSLMLNYKYESYTHLIAHIPIGEGKASIQSYAGYAIFVNKKKKCMFTEKELILSDFDSSNKSPYQWPEDSIIQFIYPATIGKCFVCTDKNICLYDFTNKKIAWSGLPGKSIKYISWSKNFKFVAMVVKPENLLIIADKAMKCLKQVKLSSGIRSGFFDDNDCFVYSVSEHVKYMFPNGTEGILYDRLELVDAFHLTPKKLYIFDQNGVVSTVPLNTSEYRLKLSMYKKKYEAVAKLLSSGEVKGNAPIKFLEEQGFPELSLQFEKNDKAKFQMALNSGNLKVAFEVAQQLKQKDLFGPLAVEAMKQGKKSLAEKCYQKTMEIDKLTMHYATTGSQSKIKGVQNIIKEQDLPLQNVLLTSMLLGDVKERAETLLKCGQVALAYTLSKIHNLTDINEKAKQLLAADPTNNQELLNQDYSGITPIVPLEPVNKEVGDWPQIVLEKPKDVDDLMETTEEADNTALDDIMNTKPKEEATQKPAEAVTQWNEDVNIDDLLEDTKEVAPQKEDKQGEAIEFSKRKVRSSIIPAYYACLGEFTNALSMLSKQIGLMNAQPLKPLFIMMHSMSTCKIGILPNVVPIDLRINVNGIPHVPINMQYVKSLISSGYSYTLKGEFQNALQAFQRALQSITMVCCKQHQEEDEIKTTIKHCVEYIIAMRCAVQKVQIGASNQNRAAELSLYMTAAKLKPEHRILTLVNAIILVSKIKNYITGAYLCDEYLSYESEISLIKPQDIEKYKKYRAKFQEKGMNEVKIDFDIANSAKQCIGYLCSDSLTPLKKKPIVCPFDGSTFDEKCAGKLCPNCELSRIGAETIGMKWCE